MVCSAGDGTSALDSSSRGAEDAPHGEPGKEGNDKDAADDDAERGVLGTAIVAVFDIGNRDVRAEEGCVGEASEEKQGSKAERKTCR